MSSLLRNLLPNQLLRWRKFASNFNRCAINVLEGSRSAAKLDKSIAYSTNLIDTPLKIAW